MKTSLSRIILILVPVLLQAKAFYGQPKTNVDSLRRDISENRNDTLLMRDFGELSYYYIEIAPDSAYYFAEMCYDYAGKLGYRLNQAHALSDMGYLSMNLGDYPKSLQKFLAAIRISEDPTSKNKVLPSKFVYIPYTKIELEQDPEIQRLSELTNAFQLVGIVYRNAGNNEKAKEYYLQARKLTGITRNKRLLSSIDGTLGTSYLQLKQLDSARLTLEEAYRLSEEIGFTKYQGSYLLNLAKTYAALGNRELAKSTFINALNACTEQKYLHGVVVCYLALGDQYFGVGNPDSSLYYLQSAVNLSRKISTPNLIQRSYSALASYYKKNNRSDSVVKYQDLVIQINDTLFSASQSRQFQAIDFEDIKKQLEDEAEKEARLYRVRLYSLLGGLVLILILAMVLWHNNQQRKRSYLLLKKQKQETDFQKLKAEKTLEDLKAAQRQLIQSEKMASLGELTAGIAHEIQNPLNFVNNFSDINIEITEDLRTAFNNSNPEEIESLLDQLLANEKKVKLHGQRAERIVKSMLQHSRKDSGEKEPVEINKLVNDHIQLAYHGFRAKDQLFNVVLEEKFDPEVGKIAIVAQEMGRVLLNLLNNAFFAVHEKKKKDTDGYLPKVKITTEKKDGWVNIKIEDNGPGIPEASRDKIFQPFYTTKQTGMGTGLGLSLSYDIIKAHDGMLTLESEEGAGTIFKISVPADPAVT